MIRVLSLNVTDGGTALHRPLLTRLDELAPDLLTLQEIRNATLGRWRTDLAAAGYHVADTFELARHHGHPHPGPFREDGLLIASRWPITPTDPTSWGLPWPERLLSATVHHPDRDLELHTVHVPNASTGITLYRKGHHALGRERLMKKLETFEGVHRALTASPTTPRILTGDLNTPHTERPDGTVRYWQHSCPAALRPELEARWEAAERAVVEGLRDAWPHRRLPARPRPQRRRLQLGARRQPEPLPLRPRLRLPRVHRHRLHLPARVPAQRQPPRRHPRRAGMGVRPWTISPRSDAESSSGRSSGGASSSCPRSCGCIPGSCSSRWGSGGWSPRAGRKRRATQLRPAQRKRDGRATSDPTPPTLPPSDADPSAIMMVSSSGC
jgi:exonuclease III